MVSWARLKADDAWAEIARWLTYCAPTVHVKICSRLQQIKTNMYISSPCLLLLPGQTAAICLFAPKPWRALSGIGISSLLRPTCTVFGKRTSHILLMHALTVHRAKQFSTGFISRKLITKQYKISHYTHRCAHLTACNAGIVVKITLTAVMASFNVEHKQGIK